MRYTLNTQPTISPSPQTVKVTLQAAGGIICNYPYCTPGWSSTGYFYLDVVHNGVTTQVALGSASSSGAFSWTFSTTLTLYSGDTVYGFVNFTAICKNYFGQCLLMGGMGFSLFSHWYSALVSSLSYSYTRESRLAKTTYPNGTAESFTYDAVGNRVERVYQGVALFYAYDADNELSSSNDGVNYTSYAYDANGNEVARTPGTGYGTLGSRYAYDYANDLVAAYRTEILTQGTSSTGCGANAGCTYTQTMPALAPSPQAVTVSISGTATAEDDIDTTCPTATASWYYVLDGVQTLLQTSTITLRYHLKAGSCFGSVSARFSPTIPLHTGDTLYELIVVSSGNPNVYGGGTSMSLSLQPTTALLASTSYGPNGLRTGRTNASGTTTYSYDLLGGGTPTGEYSAGSLKAQMLYGADGTPLERIAGGAGDYVHTDALGSVTSVTDASGGLQSAFRYASYGATSQAYDAIGDPYRYVGQAWDPNVSLDALGARYYDPSTGRFLSTDPLGSAGTTAYAYAGDKPSRLCAVTPIRGGDSLTLAGIDTVAVVVSDGAKAIAWYRDVLGLEVAYIGPEEASPDPAVQGSAEHPGHWVEVGPRRPETRIHLCVLSGRTEPGPTGITFLTDDIQGDYDRMRGKGVRFLSAPQKMDWGEWLCAFVDPDGNEFDLKEPAKPSVANG